MNFKVIRMTKKISSSSSKDMKCSVKLSWNQHWKERIMLRCSIRVLTARKMRLTKKMKNSLICQTVNLNLSPISLHTKLHTSQNSRSNQLPQVSSIRHPTTEIFSVVLRLTISIIILIKIVLSFLQLTTMPFKAH